ncbi:MAG: hypothetical protein ACRD1H_06145, partial [Vicinamibacterales bacterium]
FELLDGEPVRSIDLGPNEVRSLSYRIRAKHVGSHDLQVIARAPQLADAIVRSVAVEPDGRKVEQVENGLLDEPATVTLTVPENAVPGSAVAVVKLYPSSFSQLVEGLDGIFQRPYGCFEQTSSTTYPNVLALTYLKETNKTAPEVEAKARQYIHLGYQRLVSFEVPGGGFDWFGNPPANVTLTAYGLMEFVDMAKVHDVDPNLIQRTRNWLLSQRQVDGSWQVEGMLDDGLAGSVRRGNVHVATTAYVARAVFGDGAAADQARPTLDFLLAHPAGRIDNPYTLAIMAGALAAIDPQAEHAKPYVDRLDALKKTDETGKRVWWDLGEGAETTFYGSGPSGNIEVTALATLVMMETDAHAATVRKALTWLVEQRDAQGTWHSTQATVLSLKALIAGTQNPLGGEQPRTIDIAVGGQTVRTIEIPADQSEVMQQINLSEHLRPGETTIALTERTETGTGYQVAFRYHVPEEAAEPTESEPLQIELVYDRTSLAVHETVTATATITNTMDEDAPMVILDLPIPAGFRIDPAELEELVA